MSMSRRSGHYRAHKSKLLRWHNRKAVAESVAAPPNKLPASNPRQKHSRADGTALQSVARPEPTANALHTKRPRPASTNARNPPRNNPPPPETASRSAPEYPSCSPDSLRHRARNERQNANESSRHPANRSKDRLFPETWPSTAQKTTRKRAKKQFYVP